MDSIEDMRKPEIKGSMDVLRIVRDFVRERLAEAEGVGASGEIAAYETVLDKIKELWNQL